MTLAAPAGGVSALPAGGGSPQAGAPSSVQMATPQAKLGEQAKAKASISMAMRVLYMSGAAFDPMSEESKAIRKAMDVLSKAFGATEHDSKDLVPTEIATLMSGMKPPQMGGGPARPGAAAPMMGGAGPAPGGM